MVDGAEFIGEGAGIGDEGPAAQADGAVADIHEFDDIGAHAIRGVKAVAAAGGAFAGAGEIDVNAALAVGADRFAVFVAVTEAVDFLFRVAIEVAVDVQAFGEVLAVEGIIVGDLQVGFLDIHAIVRVGLKERDHGPGGDFGMFSVVGAVMGPGADLGVVVAGGEIDVIFGGELRSVDEQGAVGRPLDFEDFSGEGTRSCRAVDTEVAIAPQVFWPAHTIIFYKFAAPGAEELAELFEPISIAAGLERAAIKFERDTRRSEAHGREIDSEGSGAVEALALRGIIAGNGAGVAVVVETIEVRE